MAAKAGEIARESGVYRCMSCSDTLGVSDGRPIPECPSCGHESFHTGWRALNPRPSPLRQLVLAN